MEKLDSKCLPPRKVWSKKKKWKPVMALLFYEVHWLLRSSRDGLCSCDRPPFSQDNEASVSPYCLHFWVQCHYSVKMGSSTLHKILLSCQSSRAGIRRQHYSFFYWLSSHIKKADYTIFSRALLSILSVQIQGRTSQCLKNWKKSNFTALWAN